MDRLRAIRAFAAVVEARSYSVAAEKLGLSRSHLSKQIKDLENELGVRLLNRTPKKVRPTELGLGYYHTCERVIAQLTEGERALAQARDTPSGVLKVLAPKSFAVLELLPAVGDFGARHPAVEVEVHLNDQWLDLLDHGFDLAIRFGALPNSTLVSRRIGHVHYVVCASPDYLKAHDKPTRPADLSAHECVRHLVGTDDSKWNFVGPNGPEHVEVRGKLSSNSTILIREAVLRGYGVGMLPSYSVERDVAEGAVIPLLSRYRAPQLPVHAVYPPSRHLAAKVRLFIDFLVTRYAHLV